MANHSMQYSSQWLSARNLTTIVALLLATIYSAWLIKVTAPVTQEVRYSDNVPDYYLTDVIAQEFNAQGQLLHQLITPKLVHLPANDTLLLRTPHITVFSEDKPPQAPWQITALHGKTIQNNKHAWLWGNVVLHQDESAQNKSVTILTSHMTVDPAKSIAESHDPVTVIEPGLEVHSVGMRAFLKEKRVDLLSRAEGVYDVNAAGDK